MVGKTNFMDWFFNVYLKKFSTPPRNDAYAWTTDNLAQKNFIIEGEEKFKNPVTFTKKQLALYFTTQSNVIAAIDNGETIYKEVENWLSRQLTPFFENEASDFRRCAYSSPFVALP